MSAVPSLNKKAAITLSDKYKAATDAHRHYDVVSQGALIGAFAVTGAIFTKGDLFGVSVSSLFGMFFVYLFSKLYIVSSATANICRSLARELEQGHSKTLGIYSKFIEGRIQARSATRLNEALNTSCGVLKPKRLRGL
jgi:hypothetical protein